MSSLPLRVWDGTQWLDIGVQGGTVLYQNEEPASPQTGMIWIDADSETSVLNDEDYLTLSTASATYAPSASPTFTGEVNLPGTTNYDGSLLSDTLASKLDLAGGKILQIVRATDSTQRNTNSTTFVDSSLSVTITPQKSDSAVLLIASFAAIAFSSSVNELRLVSQITDSSNNAISGSEARFDGVTGVSYLGTATAENSVTLIGYATPATTSATTYKMRIRVVNPSTTGRLNNDSNTAQMFAIEVSA